MSARPKSAPATTRAGRIRLSVEEVAFFDPPRKVVISHTRQGNLILMDDGLLAPVGLRDQACSGALLAPIAGKQRPAENIREAILGCLEVRAEQGMPLTVETRLIEVAAA